MPLAPDDIDALVNLARKEIELVERLRAALEAGDTQRALELARVVAGLPRETDG